MKNNATPPSQLLKKSPVSVSGKLRKEQKRKRRIAGTFPATILIDKQEGHPFTFANLEGDSPKFVPWSVITKRADLRPYGDYTLEGYERQVAIERKSLSDLYQTISQGRDKFVRELERLATLEYAAVIIEAGWRRILEEPPEMAKLLPRVIIRSVMAWTIRYPNIHWWPCESRRMAEGVCFQLLRWYWCELHVCAWCGKEHINGPENCEKVDDGREPCLMGI